MSTEPFSDFVERITAAIPSAHVEVVSRPGDERGEVVVYTGLWLNEDDDTLAVEP